jgi:ABC-2 type transport system ATP-binding protein
MQLLKLTGIKKEFNNKAALAGIDISVAIGSSLIIFGPNGAGKTTLMKIMAGIMEPSDGEIFYKGKRMSFNGQQSEVYYLGHKNALYNALTVKENLDFTASLFGKRRTEPVEAVLQEHGFWQTRNALVQELSQGMKRRLAITRGFLTNQSLLILDEPFAGLDIKWRRSISNKINDLKKKGKSLVISTHLAEEGYELADSIAFLHQGKVKFIKKKEELEVSDIRTLFNSTDEELEKWVS